MRMTPVRTFTIVGGGTAGWMTAAALIRILGPGYSVRLVESSEIGTIGVGEATIPGIRNFNAGVGLDEDAFLRETGGTFKLGIEFVDWRRRGHSYIHGFGKFGHDRGGVAFHQYWLREFLAGRAADLSDFSLNVRAARDNRFLRPPVGMQGSPLGDIAYAFHFDASRYARMLRRHAENQGVARVEGTVVSVERHPESGYLRAVVLGDGRRVDGDFFIDCTGQRCLLLGETLGIGFEDWSEWLRCDRALAVPSTDSASLLPYTRSTARSSGWHWRIPLQHRVGNGHVYSSRYCSDDEACSDLLGALAGEPLAEPRLIRFRTGRRRQAWAANCVAVGLSAGFLEPLESTSIHLIQSAINRLRAFLPGEGIAEAEVDEFNAQTAFEYERIRDFIILHYHLTERRDTPFWRDCAALHVPATLRKKMDLYKVRGRIFRTADELFAEPSWLQVLHGQGLLPAGYDPLADALGDGEIASMLADVHRVIGKCVEVMPSHRDFIARHCSTLDRTGAA